MTDPARLRPRLILAVILIGLLVIFVLEKAGGEPQAPGTRTADRENREGREDREEIVGLPCEGCEAVFEGMPPAVSLASRARIAPADTPGEAMRIEGTVFDREGRPAPGVIVYAYQTDAGGIYPTDDSMRGKAAHRHGTLRGWAVTDGAGGYRFDTIRPAGYPGTNIPAHVHMHVIEPGRCTYYIDDIMFERDPRLTPANRAMLAHGRAGNGIVMPSRGEDGMVLVRRDIVLGEMIPGYPEAAGAQATPPAGEAPAAGTAPAALSTPALLYERARTLSLGLSLDAAIHALRAAFAAGYETPMQVVTDSRLFSLIADPEMRPLLRDALRDHARESVATMVSPEEPGAVLAFQGIVVDERTGEPVAGARVELAQADAMGLYAMQTAAWNPRLFAYLRTAADGSFRVRTIHPAAYKDDEGALVPSHIHFSIMADGYRPYDSETPLDDDPLLVDNAREEAMREGLPVTRVEVVDGIATGTVRIPLQAVGR